MNDCKDQKIKQKGQNWLFFFIVNACKRFLLYCSLSKVVELHVHSTTLQNKLPKRNLSFPL